MLIDAHCHSGHFRGLITGAKPPEALVAAFDRSGVEAGMMSVLNPHDMRAANDATMDACRRFTGRIFGYVYLNPTFYEAASEELERCSAHDCFRGVKLHPMNDVYYPFIKDYFPLYARIEALGLPVLWHSGTSPYSHPLQIAYVATKFPKMPCILGHFGLSDLTWECFPAADLAPNVMVDTTANPIVPVLNDWLDTFGPERMLWGSDFPFYDVEYERQKLAHLGRSDRDRELIAGGNAKRLFKL